MADENHLRVLRLGVNAWNEWRRKNPEILNPNLSEADLKGAFLSGVNLSGSNLCRANLQGSNLYEADLKWADLEGANLIGANLNESDLRWVNSNQANFSKASLNRAIVSERGDWNKDHAVTIAAVYSPEQFPELKKGQIVQIGLLSSKLTEEHTPENETIIQRISQIIQKVPQNQRSDLVTRLKSWLKQRDEIFNLLLPRDQIDIIQQQINENNLTANKNNIEKLAKNIGRIYPKEVPFFVGIIKPWLKKHEAIFGFLPPWEQIKILSEQLLEKDRVENQYTIKQISQILEKVPSEERPFLLAGLKSWLKKHEAIFGFLPPWEQIKILSEQLLEEDKVENQDTIKQISQILEKVSSEERPFLLAGLRPWIKEHELIFKLLPPVKQIDILSGRLTKQELPDQEETIQLIAKIIEKSSPNQHPDLVARLQDSVKLNPAIFPFLSDHEKIEYAYLLLELGSASFWQKLSHESKILCGYLILKKNKNFSPIVDTLLKFNSTEKETHLLVRCVLKLLWAKANPSKTQKVFLNVDKLILEYVITKANSTTEFLTLYSLLPRCRPRIANYCEAKPWEKEKGKPLQEQNYAWCLRAKRKCHLFDKNPQADENLNTGNDFLLEGARIYANCSQHWKNWSLLELFEATGVVPQLPGLKHPEEYVPKLSAWVNRINEIRERLKCSVCNQLMPHNVKYSKFSTKFRVTVFDCQQGDNHDKGVYLNECWGWGCHQIIDNRESKFKQEDYYICIHCGSGSPNSNTYTPGDICPKCGSKEGMKKSESNNRERKCPSCNHSIRLPYQVKITDSKVDNNSDPGSEDIEF